MIVKPCELPLALTDFVHSLWMHPDILR